MKKICTVIMALIATMSLWAADFEVDGIAYNQLGGDSVAVTSNSTKYSGDITIPATVSYNSNNYRVTSIGYSAFSYCTSLTSITIPTSVTNIDTDAFFYCTSLISVTIPTSIEWIGSSVFYNCTKLSSVTIENGLQYIGSSAFSKCNSLSSISFPQSLITLKKEALYNCPSLSEINVDPKNKNFKSIDGVLFTYNKDTLIQYPIGNIRTEYTIPDSVKFIGFAAFSGCKILKNITIPISITGIDEYAINCYIPSITCFAINPPEMVSNSISSKENSILYVPGGSISTYKAADYWKNFKEIKPYCNCEDIIYLADTLNTCQQEPLQWRNMVLNSSGNYYDTIFNQYGCDSIIYSITLTIYPTYSYIKDTTNITQGDSIVFNYGKPWQKIVYPTITGIIGDTLQSIHGCDSIINHYVKVTPVYDFSYCANDSNGGTIKSSHEEGRYKQYTKITLEAVANEGYQFICWSNNDTSKNLSLSLYNHTTIKAIFLKNNSKDTNEGRLEGVFSVAKGRCVKFAKGNLQYNVAQGTHACADTTTQPGTWRFAEHQYDVAGANNLSRSATYNGWIDLFYYGTSGYNEMMPYSSNYHSDHMDDMGYILTTNYDFGEYNSISNGGNEPGLWRLFTVAEWQYIMYNREHAKDLSGHATVCGVKGVLIFPDVYIYKLGKTSYKFYPRSTSDWTKASNLAAYNVYNETTWKQVEADGAVFLPFEKPLRSTWNTKSPTGAEQLYMDEDNCFYMTPCRGNLPSVEYIGFSEQDIYAAISTNSKGVCVRLISTKFYKPELPKFEVKAIAADTIMGSVDGAGKYEQDSAINLTAKANYGYHFTQWNDGNKDNPRQIVVTKDTSFIAYFEKESYTITTNATNGTIEAESTALYKDTVTLTATPNVGYHFTQWQDGNTDNPRKIEIVQDTTMTALFAMNYNGMCGDSLYWAYEDGKLQITGKGAMYDFESGKAPWALFVDSITAITLTTELTTIGKYAFAGCVNITEIVMGANVEEIGAYAFASCKKLTNIACFAVNPPKSETSTFATYKATLVVVCESQTAYEDDDVFGSFKTIKCDGATEVTDPITDPTVVPTDTTAVIIWPKDNDAASYQIVIKKDGNVYIILTFNKWGMLIGISLAPGRGANNAVMAATEVNGGFQFTITSLDPATTYSYDITSKREDSSIIKSYDGEFTTTNGTDTPTDLLKVNGKDVKANKILINGQMYILREGKMYNTVGQEQ